MTTIDCVQKYIQLKTITNIYAFQHFTVITCGFAYLDI